jgi:hypothetical protein
VSAVRTLAAIIVSTLWLVLLAVPPAKAAWNPGAEIVSASLQKLEIADAASQSADIADDGRYVVFQTRASNLFDASDPGPAGYVRTGGVFRRDLETGVLELVADGDLRFPGDPSNSTARVLGARNPSVSADGRYVAFTSGQRLVAADLNDKLDVYVRDMTVPIREAGAFDLVSARDGGDVPAAYGNPSIPQTGADVARNAAISADGNEVVFRTTDSSDLPARAATDAGFGQALVRDRTADTTTLVTRLAATGEPAGGVQSPGPAISGDGSTVVWNGQNATGQTTFIGGEFADDSSPYYLWRRVTDGPAAPTRRITGQVDLDDPGCASGGSIVPDATATGPCYGPLTGPEGVAPSNIAGKLPALSADGDRVAFTVGAGPRPNNNTGQNQDLYLTDMRTGATRKSGTIELTRDSSTGTSETDSAIDGLALSADGRYAAIATPRIQFLLPSPVFVGAASQLFNYEEIYVIDLQRMEIERAVTGADGGEVDSSAGTDLSLSRDGGKLAFVSSAANLFTGDSNQAADAFVASRRLETGGGGGAGEDVTALAESGGGGGGARPRLALALARVRAGIRVKVRVPGPGVLDASIATTSSARRSRTLSRARLRPRVSGLQTLTLRPKGRDRRLLRRRGRLKAKLLVRFWPAGSGTVLRAERGVSLRR